MMIAFGATLVVPLRGRFLFDDTQSQVAWGLATGSIGIPVTGLLLLKGKAVAGDGGDRVSAFTR